MNARRIITGICCQIFQRPTWFMHAVAAVASGKPNRNGNPANDAWEERVHTREYCLASRELMCVLAADLYSKI